MKNLNALLVKPAGPDCNLNCTYCFYIDKASLFEPGNHRMSEETLENMISQVMKQTGNEVSIAWQGGEPTLMGLPFYKKAVEFEIKYGQGKTVGNGFQTNGLLLTEEWADFFKKYNFLVGISLDGPKHIHDHYRMTPNGKGSWDIVSKNARMLVRKGVEVNAMTTITDYSADYAKEIYEFHKSMGLSFMQFIPIVETDKNHPERSAGFSVSGEKYGRFLCQIFDLWLEDYAKGTNTTSVRHIESVFYRYAGLQSPECTLMRECGVYLVVEHNGNIYPCDFFVRPELKLGNLNQDRLTDMLNSEKMKTFGMKKTQLPEICLPCKWKFYCHGGCVKDRVRDQRDAGNNHFCTAYKMFLEHADPFLRAMAADYHRQKSQENKTFDASGFFG
ncbi:MAG: anaerobic sulfatase maturase [Bacteroidota bacterium]|nr:anaerobic sulfatase maturase [Bacteroidota bacterium]